MLTDLPKMTQKVKAKPELEYFLHSLKYIPMSKNKLWEKKKECVEKQGEHLT